jgi:hypothetical protein
MNFNNYKLREQIEDGDATQTKGLNGYLTAAGFQVFTRLNAPSKFQSIRPRVELRADVGEATGRRAVRPDGGLVFDAFHFRLAVQAVTSLRNNNADNEMAESFLAQIRNTLCTVGAQQSLSDMVNFPNIYIAEILRDAGQTNHVDAEKGIEYNILAYEGITCFRPTALN